jgi:uncharacterized protein YqeY
MTDLYSTLKTDLLLSRKQKESVKVLLLSTLIGEIETQKSKSKTNTITDELVLSVIKYFIKNIDTSLLINSTKLINSTQQLLNEKEILLAYCPVLLSEEQTLTLIQELISKETALPIKAGTIMKQLATYNVDRKLAMSLVTKELT